MFKKLGITIHDPMVCGNMYSGREILVRKASTPPYPTQVGGGRKYYQRICNRRVRHKKDLYQGAEYKKVYDLWWDYD